MKLPDSPVKILLDTNMCIYIMNRRPVHVVERFKQYKPGDIDVFAGHEERVNDGQNDYFDLLCDLIEKYETETIPVPKLNSLALLKYLVEEHGLSGADLSRILEKSLPLGRMILRGERKITAAHAVLLGKHFGLRPDAFIT